MLGYTNVERFVGGIDEWVLSERASEVHSAGQVQLDIDDGAVVVDMRSPTAFNAGHIEGAWNHSAASLIANPTGVLSGVSFDTTVILYGAGGPVAEEYEAAEAVSTAGWKKVRYYSPGWAGWD
jgi:rhodanese-related sulfurtransferase